MAKKKPLIIQSTGAIEMIASLDYIDGAIIKNDFNPTGTTKALYEDGVYRVPSGGGGGISHAQAMSRTSLGF